MAGKRGGGGFEAVERCVQQFTEDLRAEARRERGQSRPRSKDSLLYRSNPDGAFRKIVAPAPPCPIPLGQLFHHFWGVFAEDARAGRRPADLRPLPRLESDGAALGAPFTAAEVKAAIKRTKNGAPGEDEIRFELLKKGDPGGERLARIFEGCRGFGRTPAAWKRARAVLKFKRGDPREVGNWRPLFLCNTMYKLYAKCLGERTARWAAAGEALSPPQKGFQGQAAVAEHRFLLQSVLDQARRSERECAVAWLDLADAYGSIPRRHVWETLAELGAPDGFLGLLRELSEGFTATIQVRKEEKSDSIPLRTGLMQGCPLSPILFHLAIEPLIRFIESRSQGFCLYGARVGMLVYTDDMVLVAEDAQELQSMLDDATAVADWIGLRFKAEKCKSLHCIAGACEATEFTVQGRAMSCLKEGDTVQYLGMPIGFQMQPETCVRDFMDAMENIKRSRLERWQKAKMVKGTLLLKILRVHREQPVPKKDLYMIEDEITTALSTWGSHGQREVGELTIEELRDMEVVAHAFFLLSSPDDVVKTVAQGALHDLVHESFAENPDREDMASYLNGFNEKLVRHKNGHFASLWARARFATRRLSKLITCRWAYNGDEVCLAVPGNVIYPARRMTLAGALKRAVSKEKKKQWGMANHYAR